MWNISFSQGSQKFLSLLSTPESVIKTWNLHHPIAAQVLHCFEYWCLRGIKLNASISFFCFKESSSQLIDGWHYFLSSYLSLRVKLLVFIYIKYLSIISGFKQILFFFLNNCIYLFISDCAGSCLLCGLFSSLGERGYSLFAVRGFLTVVISPVAQAAGCLGLQQLPHMGSAGATPEL